MKGGQSRHFYKITKDEGKVVEADWAASAKSANGNVMALSGHNVYIFDQNHKIKKLVVKNN